MAGGPPHFQEHEMSKAPAKKEAADTAKPPAAKSKLILIVVVAVLVLGGGGAAAYFMMSKKGGATKEKEVKEHSSKPPVFLNLESFTVNLQPENGEQFLQVTASLKLHGKEVEEKIKALTPEIRHKALLLLSAKKASEISSTEGREQLAEDLRREISVIIDGEPVRKPKRGSRSKAKAEEQEAEPAAGPSAEDSIQGVLFTSFIIQ
jgi:flagellar protein FliL